MKEPDPHVIGGLTVLMLLSWLGFVFHRSPRFAGSLWGGVLGISGAVLMLVPLLYLIIKRIRILREMVTKRVSMRTLLAWHIYAGTIGPVLAVLHTGHKFVSPLGIWLTAMMLIVALSGFAGRYLMSQFSETIREKKEMLTQLELVYWQAAGEMPARRDLVDPQVGYWSRLAGMFFLGDMRTGQWSMASPVNIFRLVESMADFEYAIKTHETFKHWFAMWLKFHIGSSFFLYVLLFLHVWAEIHFGLRWFS